MDDEVQLSPGKILLRLEELRRWQKQQEERLLEQQSFQRRLLEDQHNQVYETLSNSCSSNGHEDEDNSTLDDSNKSFTNCNLPKEMNKRRNKLENLSTLIDGVSALNISRESEPVLSPVLSSARSNHSDVEIHENIADPERNLVDILLLQKDENNLQKKTFSRRQENTVNKIITDSCKNKAVNFKLDDIPIIPNVKDFEILLKNEVDKNSDFLKNDDGVKKRIKKKPYLKRGQGMTRYKMSQEDIGLAKQMLPWKKNTNSVANKKEKIQPQENKNVHFECKKIVENKVDNSENVDKVNESTKIKKKLDYIVKENYNDEYFIDCEDSRSNLTGEIAELLKSKQPWYSVLTQEQEKYIRLLGQTSKYQQYFHSDSSDCSSLMTSPSLNRVRDNKEIAEQKLFDLLEKKVDNVSFTSNSSFIKKIIGGADTPTLNKEYLENNPHILNLKPHLSDLDIDENLNTSQSSVECSVKKIGKIDKDITDDDTDIGEYTDSTDSEPTCKEVGNNKGCGILTSTPNQASINNQDNSTNKDQNKIIKIVISEDSSTANDSKSSIDEKTIVQTDESCFSDMTNKAEMLKSRLEDLRNEIEVFKRENEAIAEIKRALEEEKENFLKEKADIERKFNEDKIVAEYYLAEEKEKLAKQKSLYDRHIKEMKNQTSRKDREEIVNLKKEMTDLKDQIKAKDAKNGASLARLRNQIKCLERDKDELKFDKDKLQKENTRLQNANMRSRTLSNIKCLAEINRTLSQNALNYKNDDPEIEDVFPNKTISTEYNSKNLKVNKPILKPTVIKHSKPFKRTKSAPNLTSHYAKYFSKRDEEDERYAREELGYGLESDQNDLSDDEQPFQKYDRRKSLNKSRTPDYPTVDYYKNRSPSKSDKNFNRSLSDLPPINDRSFTDLPISKYSEKEYSKKFNESTNLVSITDDSRNVVSQNVETITNKPISLEDHVVIDREDGSKEVKFSNGNIKIISSDGSYSKFLFYNGDIKETFFKEGTIKYYYKEVNVHHTTYRDESQLLVFPDGHIERRYPDGSVESQLPDGATRWTRVGGVQEWKFPDGTVLIVSPQGDRTLRFPNGQIEVHTKEYKRREFPDGTVKVIYADGVVETRYANGRIRVKDKQDRIFLDSAGSKQTHVS